MKKNPEAILPKLFMAISVLILLYWIWNGCLWLWDWYQATESVSGATVWREIWRFIKNNLSIIIAVYGIASLQSAGLAELKFNRSFLVAFGLALCLTPPIMMGVYGHKKG